MNCGRSNNQVTYRQVHYYNFNRADTGVSSSSSSSDNDGVNTPTSDISDEMDIDIHTELPVQEHVLAYRPKPGHKTKAKAMELHLELHPLPSGEGLIASVRPPQEPPTNIDHVSCDIVLVIDVSGSMSAEAPAPTSNPSEMERNGLSVLDLVKHAARTILETLDDGDRLGLVTFSTEAEVVQTLLPMNEDNKRSAVQRIEGLEVDSMTNLWHGILEGETSN